MLGQTFGLRYLPSPWIEVETPGGRRFCEPDGLIIAPDEALITIIEIKLRHTVNAWWQMHKVYEPAVCAAFAGGPWAIALCEVVRWYDPGEPFPAHRICHTDGFPGGLTALGPGSLGVQIWPA